MPHYFHAMHFTHSQIMPKLWKDKLSTPFISLFHETFYSYNKLFSSSDGVFKCPKHPLLYQLEKKLTKKLSKILICVIILIMSHHV